METLLAILILAIIIIILSAYNTLSWGFVTYKFYHWFAIPLFPQLPLFDYWQCIGLTLLLSLFKNHNSSYIKDEYKDKFYSNVSFFLTPWLALILAWIIKGIIS